MKKYKVSKGTVIRTSLLFLSFLNAGLALFGKSPLPIENEDLEMWINYAFMLGTGLAAWWKNNSFTHKAKVADEFLKDMKQEA